MNAVRTLLDSDSFDGWVKSGNSLNESFNDSIEVSTGLLILILMGIEPRLVVICLKISEV